jgi:hypothetical protein
MAIRAYNVKTRVMVSECEGGLYRHVGNASTVASARRAARRIERGELPADALREEARRGA